MRIFYYIYQLCVGLPVFLVSTVLTSVVTSVGCILGNGNFWGYWPGKIWSHVVCGVLLLPVRVEGRENLREGESYVFVANHQGAMDIFLIYGYLCRNFKWMMKKSLRRVPFIGFACARAHHIFVDRSGASKIEETIAQARATLQGGMSLVVFPEGTRTSTGHVGRFKKGAFLLADELQLPVVPLTIDGSFQVLPRQRGMLNFVRRHTLRLVIHRPVYPQGQGPDNIAAVMEQSRRAVCSALPGEW